MASRYKCPNCSIQLTLLSPPDARFECPECERLVTLLALEPQPTPAQPAIIPKAATASTPAADEFDLPYLPPSIPARTATPETPSAPGSPAQTSSAGRRFRTFGLIGGAAVGLVILIVALFAFRNPNNGVEQPQDVIPKEPTVTAATLPQPPSTSTPNKPEENVNPQASPPVVPTVNPKTPDNQAADTIPAPRPLEVLPRPVPEPEQSPKAGEERVFEIAPGVKMTFCWIPAGKETLGSPKEEKDRRGDEFEHEYATKGFWLGKYPVTQVEWMAVMGDNPSYFDGKKNNEAVRLNTQRFPVEQVSWDDCQTFLERLNNRAVHVENVFGKAGRFALPHEDQWEYACRGGKGNKQAFYFGNELNGRQANCNGDLPYGSNKKGDYKERTTEVGSYAKEWPHPWGLCDMHGNVWQWCDNKPGTPGNRHVLRGGAWLYGAGYCRSASRRWSAADLRFNCFGFRACISFDKQQ